MGLFGRSDDKSEHVRFKMKEKMFSIGDDYWIEDHDGHRAYKVDGKAMRVRDTWHLRDEQGREVASIHEKMMSVRDTMVIEFGGKTATLKKALIGIRERYVVEVEGGDEFKVHGNIVDHEYEIEHDDRTIADLLVEQVGRLELAPASRRRGNGDPLGRVQVLPDACSQRQC